MAQARESEQVASGVPENIRYYESVAMMSPRQTAAASTGGVKTEEISFFTLGRQFDLKLEETHPFAPGATVHWVDDTGEVAEPADDNGQFFSGRVDGDVQSWVRLTKRGSALAGVVATGDELYFLEPASRFFGEEVASETLAYRLSDTDSVLPPGSCGAIDLPKHHRSMVAHARSAHSAMHEILGAAVTAAASSGTFKRAQIGMVADSYYFNTHGTNSAADIAEIINNVDGIYRAELGVTVQILSTVVFTTQGSDPFFNTGVDANTLLNAFQSWKTANSQNSSQSMWNTDIAHLLTGRDINGPCSPGSCANNCCVIGLSYIGTLCDPSFGIGIDQDFSTALNLLTLLLSHEMGHNFGAYHDNQSNSACPCCASTPGTFIMNPVLMSTLQQKFSDCSKSFINPQVTGAGCFDTVTIQPPPPPTLNPISGGAVVVGSPLTLTGTDFTAGSVVAFFVATGNGSVMYGPYTPSSWTTTSLTLSQVNPAMSLGNGFASVIVVNTDQNYVQSNAQGALLYGSATANIPTIKAINGVALTPENPSVPLANVNTVLKQGSTVTITGTGFNNPLVALFTATGNMGPLAPVSGWTSTQFQITIPANAPTGPGSVQVVNSPYSGNVQSNTVSVPVGDPIHVTQVTQSGSTVTVMGTGFSSLTVISLFNTQGKSVVNLGGLVNGSRSLIPLTLISSNQFTFQVPAGAMTGASYVQALNPPFITPASSSGNDPGGAFNLVAN